MTPAPSPHWRPDLEERIRAHLGEALDAMNPNGSSSGANIWRLDRLLRILAHQVTIPKVTEPYEGVSLIHEAVRELKRETILRPDLMARFRDALTTIVAAHLGTPEQTFRLVLPLHLSAENVTPNETIDVLGHEFKCLSWADLNSDPVLRGWWDDLDEASADPDHPSPLPSRFVPLLLSLRARSVRLAWTEGFRAFELLRTLLNLPVTWGRIHWQSGQPRPIGRVLPPPRYAVFSEDGKMSSYYTVTSYDYGSSSRPGTGLQEARGYLTKIRDVDAVEIQTVMVDVFLRYGQALDTVDWRQAFLSLWQSLEVLTIQSGDERSGKAIRHRIALLLGQRPVDVDLLAALAETRNALVHAGVYPDESGLEELGHLKRFVERSMDALLGWADVLEGRGSLEDLYAHLSLSTRDLERRARVIEGIRRRRGAP